MDIRMPRLCILKCPLLEHLSTPSAGSFSAFATNTPQNLEESGRFSLFFGVFQGAGSRAGRAADHACERALRAD
jgi:hypothetical protein